jgi:hypothetical protein
MNVTLASTVREPAPALVMSEKARSKSAGPRASRKLKPHPERPCRDFRCLQHVSVCAFAHGTWLSEDSDPTDPRNDLRELFQTFAHEFRREHGQPRDIAARPRKAVDEPAAHANPQSPL